MSAVLVVAPSRLTRGGITAVVQAYEESWIWNKYKCYWIETYIDGASIQKVKFFLLALIKYLIRLPFYDIVHIHLSEHVSALRKCIFALPALILRKKIVVHFHSFSPDSTINSKWKPVYSFIFRYADRIIVLSPKWLKDVDLAFGHLPISVLFNPCISFNKKMIIKNQARPYILFAGTITARKGYADLVRAFKLISDDFPDWDLVLAGNGDIDSALALAAELNLSSRVILPGWVVGEKKKEFFSSASIFCLPSYAEGFPMAVLDALAFGLPVVTTPVGGIPDILENDKTALLVPSGDVEKLSSALKKLANSQDLRNFFSQQSERLSLSTFSINEIGSQLDQIYNDL